MEDKCISIIVPVYNVALYLSGCLQSLQEQTYHNIQIILVDDGSTDGSGQICDEAADKDPRIQVIHQLNKGVSAARNRGMLEVRGDYIGFVDPDDRIDLLMYEKLVSAIEKEDADAAFCAIREEYEEDGFTRTYHPKAEGTFSGEEALFQCLLPRHIGYFPSLCNKVFKKNALLTENGGLRELKENLTISEDELWLSQNLPRLEKVTLLSDPLYTYFMRQDSAMHNTLQQLERWTDLWKSKKLVLDETELYSNCNKLAKARLFQCAMYIVGEAYGESCFKSVEQIWEQRIKYRSYYYRARWYSDKQKIRFKLLEIMISLKMPSQLVKYISELTTLGIMKKKRIANLEKSLRPSRADK